MNPFVVKKITFPWTFKPDLTFLFGLPSFLVVGLFALYFDIKTGKYAVLTVVTALVIVLALFTIAAFSYRLRVDDEGFHFSWILGKRMVPWTEVDRLEKTAQGYAIHGKKAADLAPLSVLSKYAQKAIADEVIARRNLKADKNKQKYPVLELWSR